MNPNLTHREIEIYEMIKAGKTNGEIAATLWVSMETIRTHCKHIKAKVIEEYPNRSGKRRKAC